MPTTVVHFHDVKQHWNSLDQCWDDPKYVYIGRKVTRHRLPESKWANPYKISPRLSRAEAIECYRKWMSLIVGIGLKDYPIEELRDKTLVCWCVNQPVSEVRENKQCHGEILLELLGDG